MPIALPSKMTGATVFCQSCGTANSPEVETCHKCGSKLLVVSGVTEPIETTEEFFVQAQEEFEEHMLERISVLEDGVRRLSEALASTAQHLAQLEHNLTVAHAGVQSLGGLLETQGIVTRAEVVDGWERIADQELLSRDLSRRFKAHADRILSQASHSGYASTEFRDKLRALELALVGPDPEDVRGLLTDLAEMAPDSDELWSFIGEAAFQSGELETARVAFRKVLELRGPQFEALVYLGAVSSDLGQWNEAEEALTRAREMVPDAFLPHFTLGALSVLRGRHRDAVAHLERSLKIEEAPQSWYLMGLSRLELGQTGHAVKALRRATELAPDFEDALYHLGVAYLRRGWTNKALSAFQRVLRLDPQCLQYQETVRLLSGSPPNDLPRESARLVHLAEAALDEGHPERALDLFTRALGFAPGQPELQATAALLASALGRTREAIAHSHAILREPPRESPYLAAAVVALLESLRHAGRLRTAHRIATRLCRAEGVDELARGMAMYELSVVESELGENLAAARDLAREALENTPRELRHYPLEVLGSIALKRGRYQEAMQYLEQAARAGSAEPPLLRLLALARLGTGDASGAEDALRQANGGPEGGIDQELLDHVRRLGGLIGDLTRNHRSSSNQRTGRRS
jgi:tetratricopeptide (TPR) repeat protein/ribosomal protein L40E